MWTEIAGTRRIVSTLDEYQAAVIEIATRATRRLDIYTPDLEPMLYDQDGFLEPMKRLVLARSHARVRVLICDPARAAGHGHRFMQMARRLTSCINLRSVPGDHRCNPCAYIVADARAIAYRPHASRWVGFVEVSEQGINRRHVEHFESVWSGSLVQPELQPTGIDW